MLTPAMKVRGRHAGPTEEIAALGVMPFRGKEAGDQRTEVETLGHRAPLSRGRPTPGDHGPGFRSQPGVTAAGTAPRFYDPRNDLGRCGGGSTGPPRARSRSNASRAFHWRLAMTDARVPTGEISRSL